MSGVVGLINLDGREVNQDLLEHITGYLDFRGPDGRKTWVEGNVGFGHTLLRTLLEPDYPTQPFSLDGSIWIISDARIDGRTELIGKLSAGEETVLEQATDAELILRAYSRWDENCVEQLIGDFAFAIWDGERRRLFCARDHFGIKPLFYAITANCLVFSNTLNCLRTYPAVSDEPDEEVIADFLLYGFNKHLHLSAFNDISRLPPAHILLWSENEGLQIHRYWKLPVPELIRFRRKEDYIDRFQEVMGLAVGDRLRTERVGVIMSGGLDSTTVAATARDIIASRSLKCELKACTFIYDSLIPDDEERFSGEVSSALGIPVLHIRADHGKVCWEQGEGYALPPEPFFEPLTDHTITHALGFFKNIRVALTGHGGDPALHPAPSHLGMFVKSLLFGRLGLDILKYRLTYGDLPRMGIRKSIRKWLGAEKSVHPPHFPPWLNEDFSKRLRLRERWIAGLEEEEPVVALRSEAYRYLSAPMWTGLFESFDAGVTCTAVELRHPFFDLRLLAFLLALPPVPWCVDKNLLRETMRGILPELVVGRPKTPLRGFPSFELLKQQGIQDMQNIARTPCLDRFVDVKRFLSIAEKPEMLRPEEYEWLTRPIGLALWLYQPCPVKYRAQ